MISHYAHHVDAYVCAHSILVITALSASSECVEKILCISQTECK